MQKDIFTIVEEHAVNYGDFSSEIHQDTFERLRSAGDRTQWVEMGRFKMETLSKTDNLSRSRERESFQR